ncbi:MAG: stage III sporulation protein AE [Eubacteriales bacterium]|nr:stage III sporulation protein AE [Eubacteriales bacterium]
MVSFADEIDTSILNGTNIAYEDITLKNITDDILSGNWKLDVSDIISSMLSLLFSAIKANYKFICMAFVVALVSSLLLNLKTSQSSEVYEGGFYATYLVFAMLCVNSIKITFDYADYIVSQLNVFVATVIPIVLSFTAASGAFASSAALNPLIIGISQFITFAVINWLLPILNVLIVLIIVNNLSYQADLTGVINILLKSVKWIIGLMLITFVGIMTIQSMVTPALDSVAGRATKYAIANFIPVVGGIISDSVSVVAGYSSALKGAVGGAGICIGVLMCVKPLAEIGAISILFNVCSALTRTVSDRRYGDLLSGFGQVVSTLLVLVIMIMLMFVISVTIAVTVGGYSGGSL